MLNRWYHRPLLHSPSLGLEKKVTWLELFFDLIFVAAFIQLGNYLSAAVSISGFLAFAGVFVPLWVTWTGYTFYCNRFTIDDVTHRTMVFMQMFAVGGMAISAEAAIVHSQTTRFALFAAIAQLMIALMYFRSYRQVPESRDYSRYWGGVFAISGGLWLASAWVDRDIAIILWVAAPLAVLASPLATQSRLLSERYPIDFEHLGERYALLTLIVLGESFVKVLSALVAEDAGISLYLDAGVALLITGGMWWVYFDDVAGVHIRKGAVRWIVWLYAHIPLQLSLIALGVAVKKAVIFGWDAPAPAGYRWLLAGTMALAYLSVAAIDSVTHRKNAELSDRARVNVRVASGGMLLVLAPAGDSMSGGMFLALVTAVNVGHVLFDIMMAPMEVSEHVEHNKKSTADLARERAQEGGHKRRMTGFRDMNEIIRKGTPSELRSDMYFYFIEGSWLRLLTVFVFVFTLANAFFAALYTLEPGSISNTRPESFADAFYFSVQTMSTIGFGTLSPATEYGNVVVVVEAAVSIVGVAVATGMVFAKLSRPQASALFSKPMVITEMHGQSTLMFRVANARGNEVVDASISVTVVIDELSPEGHHMRRMHDLELMRSRSPMFLLSWSVMHEIDENSPLHGLDCSDPESGVGSFIVTLIGHDGTYGQTVYARHVYDITDIRTGHRFVDILHELEDGRLMVDYGDFHKTIGPEDEPESSGDGDGDGEASDEPELRER